jgi:hypothetical protein
MNNLKRIMGASKTVQTRRHFLSRLKSKSRLKKATSQFETTVHSGLKLVKPE